MAGSGVDITARHPADRSKRPRRLRPKRCFAWPGEVRSRWIRWINLKIVGLSAGFPSVSDKKNYSNLKEIAAIQVFPINFTGRSPSGLPLFGMRVFMGWNEVPLLHHIIVTSQVSNHHPSSRFSSSQLRGLYMFIPGMRFIGHDPDFQHPNIIPTISNIINHWDGEPQSQVLSHSQG